MTIFMFLWLGLATQRVGAGISGHVVKAGSQQPLEGVSIVLLRIDGPLDDSVVAVTDELGGFSQERMPAGSYRVFAERAGYVRAELSTPVVLRPDVRSEVISLELVPTAAITGSVTREFGEPAEKVFVRALTDRVVAETRTDDRGEFRLFDLPPGSYLLQVESYSVPRIIPGRGISASGQAPMDYAIQTPPCPDCPGEGQSRQPVRSILAAGGFIDPLALTNEYYPTVYYPGTAERPLAIPIELHAEEEVSGIVVQLVRRSR
jgi:hypothetical protein